MLAFFPVFFCVFIGRQPASEMEQSGIELRTAESIGRQPASEMKRKARNRTAHGGMHAATAATEMEQSGIEVSRCVRWRA